MRKFNLSQWDSEYQKTESRKNRKFNYGIPAGTYRVKVQNIQLKRSAKGDPQILWWLEIQDVPYTGDLIPHCLTFTANSTPTVLQILSHDLDICGVEVESLSQWEDPDFVEELLGLPLVVTVTKANSMLSTSIIASYSEEPENPIPTGAEVVPAKEQAKDQPKKLDFDDMIRWPRKKKKP